MTTQEESKPEAKEESEHKGETKPATPEQMAEMKKIEDAMAAKKPLPPEIELTELEALKLTAVSATAGKIIAESRFMQLQMQTTQRQLQENQGMLMGVAEEERAIAEEIAKRLGLPSVANYKMDPAQKKGVLQRPGPMRAPG
jgi:hypothetical protein